MSLPGAPALRLLHGLPGNFFAGFRPDSPADWAARHLMSVVEGTVAGRHTHVAMVCRIPKTDGGAWTVINSGSAGVSYDGDPRANYAWLEGDRRGWRTEIRHVEYDRTTLERGYPRQPCRPRAACSARCSCAPALGAAVGRRLHVVGRQQFGDEPTDMVAALRRYDASHGPGRWEFPLARKIV